jgi:hypothetical protein
VLASAYRVKTSMVAMVPLGSRERLQSLDSGSVVVPISEISAAGMVEMMHDGIVIRVFERDLFERSEPLVVDSASKRPTDMGTDDPGLIL